jgi:hypothetical protein
VNAAGPRFFSELIMTEEQACEVLQHLCRLEFYGYCAAVTLGFLLGCCVFMVVVWGKDRRWFW